MNPKLDFKTRFKDNVKKIKNWIIYLCIRFLVDLLRKLPRMDAIYLMQSIGRLVYLLAARERRKTIRHLTWAFGHEKSQTEIKRISKQVFLNISACATDAIRLPIIVKEGIDSLVTYDGFHHVQEALNQGQGMIALTGHFGNWELLGAWAAHKGINLKVVGRRIYDPRIDEILVDIRNQAGYTNIARGKGTREIIRGLMQKCTIGMLIDQDTRVEGVFVDFFGRPAHTPVGPVILSKRYGCPIVPIFIRLKNNYTYHVTCFEAISLTKSKNAQQDLIDNTQKCSDAYERIIRRYPEQWVWMHERWKKKPQTV